MTQLTFAEAEYANKKHKTRREIFLERMEKLYGVESMRPFEESLGLIHSVETTPANTADIAMDKLLHGEESNVWGDAGYQGIERRAGHTTRSVNWLIAMRPGKRAKLPAQGFLAQAEKAKASVRAKVEHPFRYIKGVFGYGKVRYRGLAKNANRLYLLAGFTNLLIGRKYLPTYG